jgi:hypothetical protein
MSESCMTEFVCFRAVRAAGSLVTAGLCSRLAMDRQDGQRLFISNSG